MFLGWTEVGEKSRLGEENVSYNHKKETKSSHMNINNRGQEI